MTHRDDERLLDARARYFATNDFGSDGGYDADWVKVKAGPVGFAFPNTDARRRAVRHHDLHHVLADYDTDWIGEAEIGAWEIASGCADHWAAWYLNLSVSIVGLLLAPKRTHRAFIRGRHTRNLYREPWETIHLTDAVGAWRQRLGLDAPGAAAESGDTAAFVGFVAAAIALGALNSALFLAPFALAVWAVAKLF